MEIYGRTSWRISGHGRKGKSGEREEPQKEPFKYDDGWRQFIESQAKDRKFWPPYGPPIIGVVFYLLAAGIYSFSPQQGGSSGDWGAKFLDFLLTRQIEFSDWAVLYFGILALVVALVALPAFTKWNQYIEESAQRTLGDVFSSFFLKQPIEELGEQEGLGQDYANRRLGRRSMVAQNQGISGGGTLNRQATLHLPANLASLILVLVTLASLAVPTDAEQFIMSGVVVLALFFGASLPVFVKHYSEAMSDVPLYVDQLREDIADVKRAQELHYQERKTVQDHLEKDGDRIKEWSWFERVVSFLYRSFCCMFAFGIAMLVPSGVFLCLRAKNTTDSWILVGALVIGILSFAIAYILRGIGGDDVVRLFTDRICDRKIVMWSYLGAILALVLAVISLVVLLVVSVVGKWWELGLLSISIMWILIIVWLKWRLPRRIDRQLGNRFTEATDRIVAILLYAEEREKEAQNAKVASEKGSAV